MILRCPLPADARFSLCCAFAADDPVLPRPVFSVASGMGVEPLLFFRRGSAPPSSKPERRRGDMQRGVPRVDVMPDLIEVIGFRSFARRTPLKSRARQTWRRSKERPGGGQVAGDDGTRQCHKLGVNIRRSH